MSIEIDKKRFFSILDQIKKEHEVSLTYKDHVLLVDGHNLIMRAFMANPTLNDNGEHVGAIVGSLMSLAYAIRMVKPTRCIIVFDGKGGSKKRRQIFPDYKGKRQVRIRVNRVYKDLVSPDDEDESIRRQLSRVISYFDCLPTKVIAMENIEADDTIAYISQQLLTDGRVTIMSSDKDFLQLADDRVNIWSATKKKMYSGETVKGEYNFSAKNFVLFRIMDGDISDNIGGVKGAGAKTVLKNFPMLAEDEVKTVDDIIAYAGYNVANGKFYKKVLDSKEILERNYKLMQLKEVDISSSTKMKILDIINSPINQLNKVDFIRLMSHDRISNNIPNLNVWFADSFALLEMNARGFNESLKNKK